MTVTLKLSELHAHSKNGIVILTRGLFEFQMRKHTTCMGTDLIAFLHSWPRMRKYSSHVCFHAFLNSLCNSGNKPLVIPFYSVQHYSVELEKYSSTMVYFGLL